MSLEGPLDLIVAGKGARPGDAEAIGCLALGELVVLMAAFDHDTSGLPRDPETPRAVSAAIAAPSRDLPQGSVRASATSPGSQNRCSVAPLPPDDACTDPAAAAGVRSGAFSARKVSKIAAVSPARAGSPDSGSMRIVTSPSGRSSDSSGTPSRARAHELDPYRQRHLGAGLSAPQRLVLIEAHPRGSDETRGEAGEPRIPEVVRRAGLAGQILAPELECSPTRAPAHHVPHHRLHQPYVARVDAALRPARRGGGVLIRGPRRIRGPLPPGSTACSQSRHTRGGCARRSTVPCESSIFSMM